MIFWIFPGSLLAGGVGGWDTPWKGAQTRELHNTVHLWNLESCGTEKSEPPTVYHESHG